MSGISSTELQMRANSLKRTPPPKAPRSNTTNMDQGSQPLITGINSVKLRKTGMRNSLIEADSPGHKEESKENVSNELSSKLAMMKAKFESPLEEAESPRPIKPSLKPKPKQYKRRPSEDDKENDTELEISQKMDDFAEDLNKNRLSSSNNKMRPLPLLQKLGPAPPKLPKPAHLKERLARYSEIDIVKYPRENPVQEVESKENGTDSINNEGGVVDEEGEELYDDLMDMQAETQKEVPETNGTSVDTSTPDEGIMEENYDDIEVVAEQVKKMNEGLETVEENGSSSDADQGSGEDLYELIGQNLVQPPPTPTSVPGSPKKKNDKKGKKELEQQKKKEKEEMKRKKEEESRREKERKARERDDKLLRKKHKLKPAGNEEVSGTGVVKLDSQNEGKLELPVRSGEVMYLLNSTENPPPGKWLVKNEKGHLGYVPTELVSVAMEEDLYDSLDVVKETVNNLTPPSVPPALPSPRTSVKHESRTEAITEEVYDDVQDGEEEELYEAVGT